MLNPIKDIYLWQKKAGNLDKPYDDFLESSFQIEEALEGFKDLPYLATRLAGDELESIPDPLTAKDISRQIVALARMDATDEEGNYLPISDVDRLDKACDAIICAIGSIAKLELDHHGITKALNIVNTANKAKLGMPRDEHGKLLKPDDFVGPEAELAKLLSEHRR